MAERSKWILRLAQTATTDDVMRIVGEFVKSRPVGLWISLPREWRPRPMLTSNDVSQYAIALVSLPSCASTADDTQTYELAGFFCAASQRLAFILAAAVAAKRDARPRAASRAPREAVQADAYPCERSAPNSFTSG